MTYEELQNAIRLFGLSERATLRQISQRHRELAKRHHPDHGAADEGPMRAINEAARVLRAYCQNYRFCFSEEEFYEQNSEERLRRQFATDPVWGSGDVHKGGAKEDR
jgi:DnaJ-class molecular chaperone